MNAPAQIMPPYKHTPLFPLGADTTLILTTDSDFFKYLKKMDGGAAKPAPAP